MLAINQPKNCPDGGDSQRHGANAVGEAFMKTPKYLVDRGHRFDRDEGPQRALSDFARNLKQASGHADQQGVFEEQKTRKAGAENLLHKPQGPIVKGALLGAITRRQGLDKQVVKRVVFTEVARREQAGQRMNRGIGGDDQDDGR